MKRPLLVLAIVVVMLAACGDDAADDEATPKASDEEVTLTIVTHDSFAVTDGVLDQFTKDTGIEVKILKGGDAGAAVNRAILTKDNPQGDVFFGIDNTFLSRAIDEDLFLRYETTELDALDSALVLDDAHRVTPIDVGDVCLNADNKYFADHDLTVPSTLDQLDDPEYKDLLVVENPATSSPGLAFLLATVDAFGEDGFADYWDGLRENGVEVSPGWEEAYYGSFSGSAGSKGARPLVVSYATSPAAEVIFSDPHVDEPPTSVLTKTCFRQIEFAGILNGTAHEVEARKLIDFLVSPTFQADVPGQMFVKPARNGIELPDEFEDFAPEPEDPFVVEPADIATNREEWIDTWTDTVLR